MISWSRTWSIAWHLHCSHNRAVKHIQISSSSESPLNHSWPWWIFPQVITDIHISPCSSSLWFLAERDYCSQSVDISTCIHKHPRMPGYKKTQSTAHVFNLTSDRFCLLLVIIKNRMLPHYGSPAITFLSSLLKDLKNLKNLVCKMFRDSIIYVRV